MIRKRIGESFNVTYTIVAYFVMTVREHIGGSNYGCFNRSIIIEEKSFFKKW